MPEIIVSNPLDFGNTGGPSTKAVHYYHFGGVACTAAGDIWCTYSFWDEAHQTLHRIDPTTGNVVFSSGQLISGHGPCALAVEPDGSWAYITTHSDDRGVSWRASIWRINLSTNQKVNFTTAGERIAVYEYGQLPSPPRELSHRQPLRGIVVRGGSIWVTDLFAGRVVEYDKVSGVFKSEQSGFPGAIGLGFQADGTLVVKNEPMSITGNRLVTASSLMAAYGKPWQPGDGAANAIREIVGVVAMPDGSTVFTDKLGVGGRIQKVDASYAPKWQQFGIEFTGSCMFHPDDPGKYISTSRNFYSIGSSWAFEGHGRTESFSVPQYFGHYDQGQLGPPQIAKIGTQYYFYFFSGNSACIYRIEGTRLSPAAMLCAQQPNPNGSNVKTRTLWSWVQGGEPITLTTPTSPADWDFFPEALSADSAGNIYAVSGQKRNIPGSPGNQAGFGVYRIMPQGTSYKWETMIQVCNEAKCAAALGHTGGLQIMQAGRADGDIYALCYVNAAGWMTRNEWIEANALVAFDPVTFATKWGVRLPQLGVGMAPIPGGGFLTGHNYPNGTMMMFGADGKLVKTFAPDPRYTGMVSGRHDARGCMAAGRDPRDGAVKLTVADNFNQRIFLYSIQDREQVMPVMPDTIKFIPRPGWLGRMVGGKFQGANVKDGPYTDLYTIATVGATNEASVDLGDYQFLRYLSPAGGWGNVAEIEFIKDGVKLTGTPYGSPGSYANSGNTFEKALDGNAATYFDAPTANGNFVGLELAAQPPPPEESGVPAEIEEALADIEDASERIRAYFEV